MISHNNLEYLPDTINQLTNLELLDVSNNRIVQINQINCMPHLRILNISGNVKLTTLPNELSTCDSLVDLILDPEKIQYPPAAVIERGTIDILNFLITGEIPDGPIVTVMDRMRRDDELLSKDKMQHTNLTYEQAYRDKVITQFLLFISPSLFLLSVCLIQVSLLSTALKLDENEIS